ncbi:MAG: beta-propeller fold lactonase family protein [Solirubrobacterales bacterium]
MKRFLLILPFTLATFVAPSAALALPPLGGLTQLAGADACFNVSGSNGCRTSATLASASDPIVSADGKYVYVVSENPSVISFSRNSVTGGLTQIDCDGGGGACGSIEAISATAGALSPDGRNLYVVDPVGSVLFFARNTSTGTVTYSDCKTSAPGPSCSPPSVPSALLDGATDVQVSPDGKNVYLAGKSQHSLVRFDRNQTTGALSFVSSNCFNQSGSDGCAAQSSLSSPTGLEITPDGTSIYVGNSGSKVSIFGRAADGLVTTAGCFGAAGCAAVGHDLASIESLALSADAANLYTTSRTSDTVAIIDRSLGGTLSQDAGKGGCISSTSATCTANSGVVDPNSIATAPGGDSTYVGTATASGDSILVFGRAAGGDLTQLATPFGCVKASTASCTAGKELDDVAGMAVSPEGDSLYAAGFTSGALSIFSREVAPSCSDVSQTFRNDTGGDVPLTCTDLNGDPITRAIATSPAHGAVTINQATGRAKYTPNSRYHGADSFTFVATDGSVTSDPATASITLTDRIGPLVEYRGRSSFRLNASAVVPVKLRCPVSEVDGCPKGKLKIGSSRRIKITLKRKLTLGSAKFSLRAGQTKSVKVKLSRTARRVVRRLRDVRVILTATSRDKAGNTGKVTKAAHVLRPRPRR